MKKILNVIKSFLTGILVIAMLVAGIISGYILLLLFIGISVFILSYLFISNREPEDKERPVKDLI